MKQQLFETYNKYAMTFNEMYANCIPRNVMFDDIVVGSERHRVFVICLKQLLFHAERWFDQLLSIHVFVHRESRTVT